MFLSSGSYVEIIDPSELIDIGSAAVGRRSLTREDMCLSGLQVATGEGSPDRLAFVSDNFFSGGVKKWDQGILSNLKSYQSYAVR